MFAKGISGFVTERDFHVELMVTLKLVGSNVPVSNVVKLKRISVDKSPTCAFNSTILYRIIKKGDCTHYYE